MRTLERKESSEKARWPHATWQYFCDTNAYICRALVQQSGDQFSATAIRRPDIVACGDSPEDAMRRLADAYKQTVESSDPVLKPISEVPPEIIRSAIERLVLVAETERRRAIAGRIPSEFDLSLIAVESEPEE
jgi:hypothetical protein